MPTTRRAEVNDGFALAFGPVARDYNESRDGEQGREEGGDVDVDGVTEQPGGGDPPDDVHDDILRSQLRDGENRESRRQQQINARRSQLRNDFTAEGVKKKAKSDATFAKHQRNNERFILYLHKEAPQHLHTEFRQELDDVLAEPDYSEVEKQYLKYRKNFRPGKNRREPKSLEERKKDYLDRLLRDAVSDALGEAGLAPSRPTVDFDSVFATDVVMDFITSCRREGGGILKKNTYSGHRSAFTYLCRRYKARPPVDFLDDMVDSMLGVKRFVAEAGQAGESNIWDGDRPLTWGLYQWFNAQFLAMGTEEGIFAAAFSKLTCVLACRNKSTGQMNLNHLSWMDEGCSVREQCNQEAASGRLQLPS